MMKAFLLFLLTLLLAACAGQSTQPEQPVIDTGLDIRINVARQLALNPGGARQCHELRALMPAGGKVQGPNCVDNKAVINGWSEKCVANGACNPGQRRQELNQEARGFCANWCAAKRCDFVYTARSTCDSSWCLTSNFCQTNCDVPRLDTCYFQQTAPNYNCQCTNPPPDPNPTVEG